MLRNIPVTKALANRIFTFQDVLSNSYYPYTFRPIPNTDIIRLKVITWRRTAICLQYGLKFSKSHPSSLFYESGFIVNRYKKGVELLADRKTLSPLFFNKVSLFYLHFELGTKTAFIQFVFVQALYSTYRLHFLMSSLNQRLIIFRRFTHALIQNSRSVCTLNIPQHKTHKT